MKNTFMRMRGISVAERTWLRGYSELRETFIDLRTPPVEGAFPIGPCRVFCIVEDKLVKVGYTYRNIYEVVERFDYKTLWTISTTEKYAIEIIELAKAAGYRIITDA